MCWRDVKVLNARNSAPRAASRLYNTHPPAVATLHTYIKLIAKLDFDSLHIWIERP